jgi:hypothetical protein
MSLGSPNWVHLFRAKVPFYGATEGSNYIMVKKNGKWEVEHVEMVWIA